MAPKNSGIYTTYMRPFIPSLETFYKNVSMVTVLNKYRVETKQWPAIMYTYLLVRHKTEEELQYNQC